MTTTKTSIATAPRDLQGLKNQGRFNLRCLAEELGVFANEQTKSSFMSLNNDEQADNILKLLKEHDKRNGGGGGGGAAAEEAPVRQPSNKKAGKGAGGAATTTAAAPNNATTSETKLGDGAAKILAALQEQKEAILQLTTSMDGLARAVRTTNEAANRNIRFTTLSMGLSLKLAEETLKAGPDQIIRAVIEDLPLVEQLLSSIAGGDGGAAGEEGDEEEEEEEEDPNE